jgi:hypothetical protein
MSIYDPSIRTIKPIRVTSIIFLYQNPLGSPNMKNLNPKLFLSDFESTITLHHRSFKIYGHHSLILTSTMSGLHWSTCTYMPCITFTFVDVSFHVLGIFQLVYSNGFIPKTNNILPCISFIASIYITLNNSQPLINFLLF